MSLRKTIGLSYQIAKADFKLKNEGTYIGILWYLLNPLFTFILLFLIFSDRLGKDIPNYPLYLLIGIIMFNFFQSSTTESIKKIFENRWIIKSINFPRESLIGAIILKNIFSHLFELILLILLLFIFKISLIGMVFYAVILIFFCFFIFGASLILSAFSVYFLDLENVWSFASRLIWLGTPIFYAVGGQTRLFYVNLFNPMFYFLTISRDVIIYARIPEFWMIFGMIFYSLMYLILGLLMFNKLKVKFAEMI